MNAPAYNFAYLDEQTKRMIRRAILKAIAIPGYQVPFASREMPMPYGWGTGGVQVTAAILGPDDVLKVIVGNPTMIAAYKSGIPGNGQPFPDGAMVAKLQWKPKKSTEAQFAVDVPDVFKQAFVMEKDSKRFSKSGGWGYAVFNYAAESHKFEADAKSLSDCGVACHTKVKAKDYIFHPYQKR